MVIVNYAPYRHYKYKKYFIIITVTAIELEIKSWNPLCKVTLVVHLNKHIDSTVTQLMSGF